MAELSVTKRSISSLFTEMQNKKFIIPEYQRPYKWDREMCETLWQDVTTFHEENIGNSEEYYLGTIVTCKSDDQKIIGFDIIDGQQRITSLLLLLRAFYAKLEDAPIQDDNVKGLMDQVGPCLWDVNAISRKVTDKSAIHIESRVATASDNGIFHKILQDGTIRPSAKDLYSQNYAFFYEQCEIYAKNNPTQWQPFCVSLLHRCIILPIECEKLDTALTIFSTLNNRGLPLSDSDIFKAQLYKNKVTVDEKNAFTEDWKELTETVTETGISLDDLFRYYSHVIRARKSDKNKEIGLRKFYSGQDGKFALLKDPKLMGELSDLADFWNSIKEQSLDVNGVVLFSREALKYLHCLSLYPNEFWKYEISVFYFANRNDPAFITLFPEFLKKLIAFLFGQFIIRPSINAIKDPCYALNIDIINKKPFKPNLQIPSNLSELISSAVSYKIARALILLHAYLNPSQTALIPQKFEIEHIFPRKWQNTNYNGWEKDEADEYLEKFGNKVAFEKKLNIQAGNGYFGKKKSHYGQSRIANVIDLATYSSDDWLKDDIQTRDDAFCAAIDAYIRENLK